MNYKHEAADSIVHIVVGLGLAVVCAPAGLVAASGAAITGTLGVSRFLSLTTRALSKHGIDNKKYLKKVRIETTKAMDLVDSKENKRELAKTNKSLAKHLPNCLLEKQEIAKLTFSNEFPLSATSLLLSKLEEHDDIFKKDYVPKEGTFSPREFAENFFKAAFSKLLSDKKYFEDLEPYLNLQIASNIGEMNRSIKKIESEIKKIRKPISQRDELKKLAEITNSNLSRSLSEFIEMVNSEYAVELEQREIEKSNADKKYKAKLPIVLKEDQVSKANLICNKDTILRGMTAQLEKATFWAKEVKFSDMRSARNVSDIYVDVDAFVCPQRLHVSDEEKQDRLKLQELMSETSRHLVILGGPGAGKTTSLKKMCLTYFFENRKSRWQFPILFRFRDMKDSDIHQNFLRDEILQKLGIEIEVLGRKIDRVEEEIKNRVFKDLMENLKPIIFLDGFDEGPSSEFKGVFLKSYKSFCELISANESALSVLTCRSGEFNYSIDNSEVYEIAPLTQKQITEFAQNWLSHKEDSVEFLRQVNESPFSDTLIKPLTLAHLCALFIRNRKIPEKPKSVYYKIVSLLIANWDDQRSIDRISQYPGFDEDRRLAFLCNVAYYLSAEKKVSVFNVPLLKECYMDIHKNFNLPEAGANSVVSELESQTGLFVQSGFEKYEFVHKSIQEYLAAVHIRGMHSIPDDLGEISNLGSEMAVAVAIASVPSNYFIALVLGVLSKKHVGSSFIDAFVSRLLLEKPELYSDELVLVALVVLFSTWVSDGYPLRADRLSKVSKNFRGRQFDHFEVLINSISAQSKSCIFLNYYQEAAGMKNKLHDFIIMERKLKSVNKFRLPPYIVVHRKIAIESLGVEGIKYI